MTPLEIPKTYTAEEVAQITKINKGTILRFIREGKLKAKKFARFYRVKEQDLQAFLDN